tara:strand:+ start:2027 stop:3193 length:1167 start_codon:yes stop_codon:yes gene_type:complete
MKCDVEDIVAQFEKEHTKDLLKKTDSLFKIVVDFMIREKVVMYGGWAINEHLPKKKRFYTEETINDFDGFIVSAKKVAHKLVNLLKKYKYVEIRESKHPNTYKVFVQGVPLCDLTDVPHKHYDILIKNCIIDENTGIRLSSPYDLKRMMLNELSQPIQSAFRWTKVYPRFLTFLSVFPDKSKITTKIYPDDKISLCINTLLKYIKEKELPLVGNVSLILHKSQKLKPYAFSKSQPFLSILAKDLKMVMKDVINLFNDHNISMSKMSLWDTTRGSIYIDDVFLLDVIDCSSSCLSVLKTKEKGYTVGSLATIGYLLYEEISYYQEDTDDLKKSADICSKMMNKCDKILTVECYGKGKMIEDVVKEYWNKKFYRYKNKIGSRNKTLFVSN